MLPSGTFPSGRLRGLAGLAIFAALALSLGGAAACGDETDGPQRLCDAGIYQDGALIATGDATVDACLATADGLSKEAEGFAVSVRDACAGLAGALGAADVWSGAESSAEGAQAACAAAVDALGRAQGGGSLGCTVDDCSEGSAATVNASGTGDDGDLEDAVEAHAPAIYAACECDAPALTDASACSSVQGGEGGDDITSCGQAAGRLIFGAVASVQYATVACLTITSRLDC